MFNRIFYENYPQNARLFFVNLGILTLTVLSDTMSSNRIQEAIEERYAGYPQMTREVIPDAAGEGAAAESRNT